MVDVAHDVSVDTGLLVVGVPPTGNDAVVWPVVKPVKLAMIERQSKESMCIVLKCKWVQCNDAAFIRERSDANWCRTLGPSRSRTQTCSIFGFIRTQIYA